MPPPSKLDRPRLATAVGRLRPELAIAHRAATVAGNPAADVLIATPAVTPLARSGIAIDLARAATPHPSPAVVDPALASRVFTPGSGFSVARLGPLRGSEMLTIAALRDLLDRRAGSDAGLTRDQINAPIAPGTSVDDTQRYQDAHSAGTFYYLPRYSLARNGEQLGVHLGKRGEQWELSFRLVPSPAPEVVAAGGGLPIAHTVTVALVYKRISTVGASTVAVEVTEQCTEITTEGSGAVTIATAVFPQLEDLNAIYRAFTENGRATRIIVNRVARIATRRPAGGGGRRPFFPLFPRRVIPIGRLPLGVEPPDLRDPPDHDL